MLTNSTLSRITADAEAYAKIYHHYKDTTYAGIEKAVYIEAASVEAERAQGLVEKLIWLEGWVSDRHGGDNPISKEIRDTLTKYNNPK